MFRQLIALTPVNQKGKGLLVVLSALVIALSEFAGLALFVPVFYLIFDKSGLSHHGWLLKLYTESGLASETQFLLLLSVLLFLVFLIKNGLTYGLQIYQNRYLIQLYQFFTLRLYSFYFDKGALFFKSENSNSLTYHVNYVSYLFVFSLLTQIIRLISEGVLFLLLSLVILILSPKVYALLVFLFVPAVFVYVKMVRSKLSEIGDRENRARKSQTRIVHETFKGYAEVKVNQAFPLLLGKFSHELDVLSDCMEERVKVTGMWQRTLEGGVMFGLLILLFFNVLIVSNPADYLTIIAFLTIALLRLLPTVKNIIGSIYQLKSNQFVWDIFKDLVGNGESTPAESTDRIRPFSDRI
ncbi:MAG: hypothetical protein LWW85_14980, partial [Marinilabiliales bacterium]|nr:hypothetical protein [Marinilabiliales bacterium]